MRLHQCHAGRSTTASLTPTPTPILTPTPTHMSTPPLPPFPQAVKSLIERLWWRNLSNPATITNVLSLVYASPVDDERLLARILEATEHPGARALPHRLRRVCALWPRMLVA